MTLRERLNTRYCSASGVRSRCNPVTLSLVSAKAYIERYSFYTTGFRERSAHTCWQTCTSMWTVWGRVMERKALAHSHVSRSVKPVRCGPWLLQVFLPKCIFFLNIPQHQYSLRPPGLPQLLTPMGTNIFQPPWHRVWDLFAYYSKMCS